MGRPTVVFDLDDTLYLERDYVRSGFCHVSESLESWLGLPGFFAAAWRRFEAGERTQIFDHALRDLGAVPEPWLVEEMLCAYRFHRPSITLLPDAEWCLETVRSWGPIAVITDGRLTTQSLKAQALGLGRYVERVAITSRWGPGYEKPAERAFHYIQASMAADGRPLVYIADNPRKDFSAPLALGWRALRIRRSGGLYAHVEMPPTFESVLEVQSLREVPGLLTPPG